MVAADGTNLPCVGENVARALRCAAEVNIYVRRGDVWKNWGRRPVQMNANESVCALFNGERHGD
jgi:hypothetical protein